jgi:putative ABC transport system ATP-binding protein
MLSTPWDMSDESKKIIARLENIGKYYSLNGPTVTALIDVTLAIHEGDFVAVTGASGSGKSTLLHILACLDYPSEGSYFFKNIEVQKLGSNALANIRSREVGIIFQEFRLIPRLSVFKNVELPLIYQGLRSRERLERVKQSLTKVGMTHRLNHSPNKLSGGERQRVAIARALVANPSLLLADEPTGNLDSAYTEDIFDELLALNREGITIVMVTHDESLAHRCQKIFRIKDGRLSLYKDENCPER